MACITPEMAASMAPMMNVAEITMADFTPHNALRTDPAQIARVLWPWHKWAPTSNT